MTPVLLSADSATYTVTPSNSANLIRVEEVRIAEVPPSSTYVSGWDASTNTPTMPAASSSNLYYFYLVTTAGTTTVDDEDSWQVGDLVVSYGTEWKKLETTAYGTVPQFNKPSQDQWKDQPQNNKSYPDGWAQEGNTIYFYPRTQCDSTVEVTLSYAPVGEIDTIPLPAEAEDVIVAGALAEILMLPGEGRDAKLAIVKDREYKQGLATLRAIGELGYGGSPYYIAENFTGRQSRLTPFRSSGGWMR